MTGNFYLYYLHGYDTVVSLAETTIAAYCLVFAVSYTSPVVNVQLKIIPFGDNIVDIKKIHSLSLLSCENYIWLIFTRNYFVLFARYPSC